MIVEQEAHDLLGEVQEALRSTATSRVANALILLPKCERAIRDLLTRLDERCLENQRFTDEHGEQLREELRTSANELRKTVWQINGQMSKLTGYQLAGPHVPVGPLTQAVNRTVAALDAVLVLTTKKEH